MDAKYTSKFIVALTVDSNLYNFKFPLLIDYALTLILYALMIALIVKVFASDHLHFRNPFEFDWDNSNQAPPPIDES